MPWGSSEKCARCGKTVYVVEKLACLDQVWHKWCFNCDVCHATLTMKNYQAIGGKPYCRAHYPAPGSSEDAKEGLDFEQDKVATEGTYENNPDPEPEQYVGQPDTGEFNAVAGGEEEYAEEEYAEEYAEEEYAEEEYAEEYEEGY